MNETTKVCFASAVSEIQQSDIYMTVKARLFETPKANLNGARVTPAFLDEIVENAEKYVGLPVCADVKALAQGRYDHLGHLYDARTGEFKSAMIGSFYQFEKEEFEGGAYLIGYARIMKRNKAVCKAIAELFADDALKFSFEISCGQYTKLEDGTIQIDADENNFLEGAAIVTFPACEDAVAMDLVAECDSLTDDERGETNMHEAEQTVMAENLEEEKEDLKEEMDVEEASCKEEKEKASEETSETAELYVTESVTQEQHVDVYDTDNGESVEVHDIHTEVNRYVAEDPAPSITPGVSVDPEGGSEDPEVDDPESGVPDSVDEDKKMAEVIAELTATIEALKEEVASIKTEMAAKVKTEDVPNPFIAEINAPKQKYELLNSTKNSTYSLLEKA